MPVGRPATSCPATAPDAVAVFCGTWQQPAAHIRADGAAGTATPMSVATSGPWRETIDLRFTCDAPTATVILGGDAQAVVLQCTRRIGGWPQVALVASVDGRMYLADGILPTLAGNRTLDRRAVGPRQRIVRRAAAIRRRHAARDAAWRRAHSAPATSANTSA